MDAGVALDAGASPDPPVIDAAVPDAPPVLGAACQITPVEIARIPNVITASDFVLRKILHADLDHDGREDVIVVDSSFHAPGSPVRIRAYLRTDDGFAPPVTSSFSFATFGPDKIILADVDGDHLTDILLAVTTPPPRVSTVTVATQAPDHTFTRTAERDLSACNFSDDERLFAFTAVDTDNDGFDDVLATISYAGIGDSPQGVSRLAGGPDGLGGARCVVSASQLHGFPADMITAEKFLVEDFNGDGRSDLAAVYFSRADPVEGIIDQVAAFPATGPSQFRTALAFVDFPSTLNQFVIDHVPGRKRQHMARLQVGETTATATRLRIDDTGIVTEPIATFPGGGNGQLFTFPFIAGDFNRDGLTDVLETVIGAQRFDLACDRGSRWDTSNGTFSDFVLDLQNFSVTADGHPTVMVQTFSDVVIYRLE